MKKKVLGLVITTLALGVVVTTAIRILKKSPSSKDKIAESQNHKKTKSYPQK